ncbi:MAG: ABC transporter ATP-binding protein [Bacteroidales bacterium]|nr:ABC transporter ATP-binding protein [Bacteroidales bacterium]
MRSFLKIAREYLSPYRGYILLNISFNLLGVIFSLFSLVLIGPFLNVLFGLQKPIDSLLPWSLNKDVLVNNFNYHIGHLIIQHGPQAALFAICGLVIVMFLLKTGNIYFANYFMAPIRNGVVRDIRNRIYRKILELPISYYSQKHKGDIMSRVTQDVQEVEWSIMASLEKLFRDPINMFIFLIGMLLMSPGLTAFVLVLLPISALIIGHIGKNLRKQSAGSQKQMGYLMSILEETLSGLRIIKSFNAENHAEKKFRKENQLFTRIMNQITRRRELASPLSEFLGSLVVVGLIAYGGNLVLIDKGHLNPASFIAYIAIFSQILTPAKSFSTAYYHLNKGLASFDRINEILNIQLKARELPGTQPVSAFQRQIIFNRVSFSYEDQPVLRNISLQLDQGKTIAIIGASGSGKSTFLDLLLRFYDPDEGSITIDGTEIRDLNIKDLRGLFGYVPQESLLFNDDFIHNIAFGDPAPDFDRVVHAARIADALDFIESKEDGFYSIIGDRGAKLSGGQRQRLGIARAVYANRPVLILDEATSALDNESEARVYLALTENLKDKTILFVAHRLSTIIRANEMVLFEEGRLIDHGTHEELLKRSQAYRHLYEKE